MTKSQTGFVSAWVMLSAVSAPGAAVCWAEGRLEVPELAASGAEVGYWTNIMRGNPDGYPAYWSFYEPETVWHSGGHSAHTVMTRPTPGALTSRTERAQSQAISGANVDAHAGAPMLPNQTHSFTLTLTDMVTPEFEYQPYLPTWIQSGLDVTLSYTLFGQRQHQAAGVRYLCTRGSAGLIRSVVVQSDFGWDTAALEAQLELSPADGYLDAPITFPTITLPADASDGGFAIHTFGNMWPTPGAGALLPVLALGAVCRRVRHA